MIRKSLALFTLACAFISLTAFVNAQQQEFGKAGYYSDSLHGRKTASGEEYDKTAYTCAHKTYPFGTRVKITRLDNNSSVIARVNDRGPYHEGYVVDLSRAAAEDLGLIKVGVTKVKVELFEEVETEVPLATTETSAKTVTKTKKGTEVVKPRQISGVEVVKPEQRSAASKAKTEKAAAAASDEDAQNVPDELYKVEIRKPERKGYAVQVSSLANAANIMTEVTKLQSHWPGKILVFVDHREDEDAETMYKILLGPFNDSKTAEGHQKELKQKGFKKTFITKLADL